MGYAAARTIVPWQHAGSCNILSVVSDVACADASDAGCPAERAWQYFVGHRTAPS